MDAKKPWEPGYLPPVYSDEEVAIAEQTEAEARSSAGRAGAATKHEHDQKLLEQYPNATPDELRELRLPMTEHGLKILEKTEANLTPQQKLLHQEFALQYLRTMDEKKAYVLATGDTTAKPATIYKKSRELLYSPYTQELIRKVVDAFEEEQLITRKDVLMALWREANSYDESTNGGSRVRALMGIARIKRMDIHVQEHKVAQVTHVMQVPMVDKDSWAQAAEESQRQLKHDVRN